MIQAAFCYPEAFPAQLVNEHIESQAKHTFDSRDLVCILSGETKTKQ